MPHKAVLQDPDTKFTSLTDVVNLANFDRVVYRISEPGASIALEGETYVQTNADGSRKVLFPKI